jgi:hypothetical protein
MAVVITKFAAAAAAVVLVVVVVVVVVVVTMPASIFFPLTLTIYSPSSAVGTMDGEVISEDEVSFEVSEAAPSSPLHGCSSPPQPQCADPAHCNGHACIDSVCVCSGDWAGPACDHSIFADPVYFPPTLPRRFPNYCHQAQHNFDGAMQLDAELQATQWPPVENCAGKSRRFGARFHGLGAQVHFLSEALASSLQSRHAMVLAGSFT